MNRNFKQQEYVVLVNDANTVVGKALKSEIHTTETPLHRGFSVFLFNSKGELLTQQRAKHKKTWPLTWSNSCCGHPGPGEESIDAAKRRLEEELGLKNVRLWNILPDFRYRAEKDGVVEHEICPVFVGFTDKEPVLNADEVEAVRWIQWEDILDDVQKTDSIYSPWCIDEVKLLADNQEFQELFHKHVTQ